MSKIYIYRQIVLALTRVNACDLTSVGKRLIRCYSGKSGSEGGNVIEYQPSYNAAVQQSFKRVANLFMDFLEEGNFFL